MKTVLGEYLVGWSDSLRRNNFQDTQLRRCPNHKKYEAGLVMKMPRDSAFLDVGAHYGDTCLTMAIHAKMHNRSDIRFYAFEPHRGKAHHIETIAKVNGLNVRVFNNCVGNSNGRASFDKTWEWYAGRASYKLADSGNVEIIKIDDVKDIVSPVAVMHVDTEGWEAEVLRGAYETMNDHLNKLVIILECWGDKTAENQIERGGAEGIATATPEKDILREMSKLKSVKQMADLVDKERNLVFKVN